jgi:hypothetical protein
VAPPKGETMSISAILSTVPEGFRDKGFTYFPLKLLLGLPFGQFRFVTYLIQRANWERASKDYGWFRFSLSKVHFQSERYVYTCLNRLKNDGVLVSFKRYGDLFEGRISTKYLGPKKESVPLNNAYLIGCIRSEKDFILSKINVLKTLHPVWSIARIREHLSAHYKGINPTFFTKYESNSKVYSEIFPGGKVFSSKYQPEKIQECRVQQPKDTEPVFEGGQEPKEAEPECKNPALSVQENSTAVQKVGGGPNIREVIRNNYENLNVKISDRQIRTNYQIPPAVAATLRFFYASLSLKYKLTEEEQSFALSVTHSLKIRSFKDQPLEEILKTVIAAIWFCTHKNRFLQTKSCIWSRVYAYAEKNNGEWLWREFMANSRVRAPIAKPKPIGNRADDGAVIAEGRNPLIVVEKPTRVEIEKKAFADYIEKFFPDVLSTSGILPWKETQKLWNQWRMSEA